MAGTQISIVQLQYMIDHAASEDVQAQLKAILKDINATGDAAREAADKTTTAVQREIQSFDDFAASIRKASIPQFTSEFDKFAYSIRNTSDELDRMKQLQPQPGDFLKGLMGDNGGGGFNFQNVSRFGSKLRALPSIQIPGLGVSTDSIANILRLSGVIDGMSKSSLAAAGAVGLASAALLILVKNAQAAEQAAKGELDARQKAFDLIRDGTTEEINDRIKQLQKDKQARQEEAQNASKLYGDFLKGIKDQFGDLGLGISAINSTLGTGAGELTAAKKSAEDANKALSATSTELDLLTQFSNTHTQTEADLAKATQAAIEAEEKLASMRYKEAQDSIDSQVKLQEQIRQLYISGGQEQLQQLKQSTQDQINTNIDKIELEQKLLATLKAGTKEYDDATQKVRDLENANTDLATSMAQLGDANLATAVKTNDAIKYQAQQQKDTADATQKYNDDVAKINEQAQAAQLAALDKYNESLVKAAENAAHAAEEALQKLQERRADLATSLARNEADAQAKYQFDQLNAQIKFQEEEAKAARDHARDLQKIREDAQAAEFDLILNRDFAGLFKSRQDTQRRLTDAERQYQDERRDRQTAYQQQNADAARQYAFDAQQRQIHYQQDLNDAALQYQRERQQIEQNRQRALIEARSAYAKEVQLVQQKEQQQLTIRRNAAVAELQMLSQTEQQRVQIMAQSQAALIQQAQSMLALVGGGGTPVVAGPVGSGILAGGTSNRTANMNFNISGNNPVNIANAVKSIVHGEIANIFG